MLFPTYSGSLDFIPSSLTTTKVKAAAEIIRDRPRFFTDLNVRFWPIADIHNAKVGGLSPPIATNITLLCHV